MSNSSKGKLQTLKPLLAPNWPMLLQVKPALEHIKKAVTTTIDRHSLSYKEFV